MKKKLMDKIDNLFVIKSTDSSFVYIIKSLIARFDQHNVAQTAGQLAYFTLLSLFPFIIFLNALISRFNLSGEIVTEFLSEIFPANLSEMIGYYVEYVTGLGSGVGVLSVGVIIALFSASKSLRSISIAINQAYGITEKRYFLIRLFLSVILTFVLGIVILLCLLAVTVGRDWIYRIIILIDIPLSWLPKISIGKWLIVFTAFLIILSLVYYTVPLKRIKLKNVIPGAVAAVFANFLLTYGYAIYVSYADSFSVLYGSMGVVLLLALWLYFVGIFIIMGAELNSILEEKKYFYAVKNIPKNK